jgi:hypothetical protein
MSDFTAIWETTNSGGTGGQRQEDRDVAYLPEDRHPVDNHEYEPGRQESPHSGESGGEWSTTSEGGVMDYVEQTGLSPREVEIVLATVNTMLLLGWLYYEVSR